jgi:small subunit ribosomal protein S16
MVRIRLKRVGGRKDPHWRIVVADRRSPRDGRNLETIGQYNPQTDPSTIVLDKERAEHWLSVGAMPTRTVATIFRTQGIESRGR